MPAIDRLLLCWSALKSYFASQGEDDVTDLIWRGFSCGEDDLSVIPECRLYFVHNVMTIFDEAVKCLEFITTTATEVHEIMVKVQANYNSDAVASSTEVLLQNFSKVMTSVQQTGRSVSVRLTTSWVVV